MIERCSAYGLITISGDRYYTIRREIYTKYWTWFDFRDLITFLNWYRMQQSTVLIFAQRLLQISTLYEWDYGFRKNAHRQRSYLSHEHNSFETIRSLSWWRRAAPISFKRLIERNLTSWSFCRSNTFTFQKTTWEMVGFATTKGRCCWMLNRLREIRDSFKSKQWIWRRKA